MNTFKSFFKGNGTIGDSTIPPGARKLPITGVVIQSASQASGSEVDVRAQSDKNLTVPGQSLPVSSHSISVPDTLLGTAFADLAAQHFGPGKSGSVDQHTKSAAKVNKKSRLDVLYLLPT